MENTNLAIVILAAGKGTRMQSALPKVMHKVAGLEMLDHVIRTAQTLSPQKIVVVAAPDQVDAFHNIVGEHAIAVQDKQLGTGHAVQAAQTSLSNFNGDILVLYGDVPLVTPTLLKNFLAHKENTKSALTIMGSEPANPHGFGRLVMAGDLPMSIVEQKDLSPGQAQIKLCNAGIVCAQSDLLWQWLGRLQNNNAQNEYYLTDIVAMAAADDVPRTVYKGCDIETMGVNDRAQLQMVEQKFQRRMRAQAMLGGVTLQDADSTYFSYDTHIAPDVTIGANVVFGAGVVVKSGAEILPFSHLEGCTVKSGARIGPFARIRPGSEIGSDARIGNFVEVKNAKFADGAKANHLSYIGDATVGENANIGAGTITCNYDGIKKSKTEIGAGAFIGSNSALVAPVAVGDGAMVAAGSVITQNVEAGALGIARGKQKNILGWATKFFSKGKL